MEVAIHMAQQFDGHIIGYFPIPGISMISYGAPGMELPHDDRLKRYYEQERDGVRSQFEERMARAGVKYEWRSEYRVEPYFRNAIIQHGRQADVVIMTHASPGSKEARENIEIVGDVLLGVGRPVIVVPPLDAKKVKFDRIAVGWNASREACRASFDSLPLLQNASTVFLTWVNPDKKLGKEGRLPGTELAAALARHDVKIETKGLSNRSNPGVALASHAKDEKVDLLVVGGYGHSRLREQILGGVTQYLLKNSPCPILFSN